MKNERSRRTHLSSRRGHDGDPFHRRNVTFIGSKVYILSGLMTCCAFLVACPEVESQQMVLTDAGSEVQAINTFLPQLGKGVNPSETETFHVCVIGGTQSETRGFDNRLYNERLVKTKSELNETMDISASVSARGMFLSGSGEASFFKNVDFQSDSVYWLVDSRYVLGHEYLDLGAAQLTETSKRILAQDDGLEAFTRACGERFYSSVQKGARYTLLYDFHGEEKKTLESILAKTSGSGFGISASAEFNRLVASANSAQYLSIHSHIQGGGSQIAEHAGDAADLRRQLQQLRSDVLDQGQGVNLQWYASTYEAFPEFQEAKARARLQGDLPRSVDEMHRENVLAYLYGVHAENRTALADIQRQHARARGSNATISLSPDVFRRGQGLLAGLSSQNDEIARLSRQCLRASADEGCSTGGIFSLLGPTSMEDLGLGSCSADDGFKDWSVSFLTDPRLTPHRHYLIASKASEDSSSGSGSFFQLPLEGHVYPGSLAQDGGYEIRARIHNNGAVQERVLGTDVEMRIPNTSISQINLCRGSYENACSIKIVEKEQGLKIIMSVFDNDGFPFSHPFIFES